VIEPERGQTMLQRGWKSSGDVIKMGRASGAATGPWTVSIWDYTRGEPRYCLQRRAPDRLSGYEIKARADCVTLFYTKALAERHAWNLNREEMMEMGTHELMRKVRSEGRDGQ
jgi:hypothetical protein